MYSQLLVRPFLYAKQGDEDSAPYELVRKCFVHGFMDGEGMKAGMAQSFTLI